MTKQQAKQRAIALYGTSLSDGFSYQLSEVRIAAYMKCWEDLKAMPKLRFLRTPVANANTDQSL